MAKPEAKIETKISCDEVCEIIELTVGELSELAEAFKLIADCGEVASFSEQPFSSCDEEMVIN